MTAEIISIGNELLNGTKQNTNAGWLCERLLKAGIETARIFTLRDDPAAIRSALAESLSRSQIVIMTGGLGPTHDDVTKPAVCEFFNATLILDSRARDHIAMIFSNRGRKLQKSNLGQALVPDNATVLYNDIGTAPGLYFAKDNSHLFVLPGVPVEMKHMTENSVFPILAKVGLISENIIEYETIRTTGISESALFELLSPIDEIEKHVQIGFLPHPFGEDITIKSTAGSQSDASKNLRFATQIIQKKASEYIYEVGSRSMENVVAELLKGQHLTLMVAESCTGGLLANLLTNIPGSSAYFLGGVIAYHNDVKSDFLQVSSSMLADFGAVSGEVACAMATGVRESRDADVGLSTTGIAGPDGGSKEKPVGLLYVGLADRDGVRSERFVFHRDRMINKSRFAYAALNILRKAVSPSK